MSRGRDCFWAGTVLALSAACLSCQRQADTATETVHPSGAPSGATKPHSRKPHSSTVRSGF